MQDLLCRYCATPFSQRTLWMVFCSSACRLKSWCRINRPRKRLARVSKEAHVR